MINHTKAHHPPETKRKASKVSHHTHGSSLKKIERREGKMIRAKV
jgi:hypothetical protein